MDDRVNDFFNEINEIVPPVTQVRSTSECVWQECFDENSGYPYYWNMHTNTVTWEMPKEYQEWLNKKNAQNINSKSNTEIKKPLFPSVVNSGTVVPTVETKTISRNINEVTGCHDVKTIRALPSYLVDSDHDSLEATNLSRNGSFGNSPLHSNNSKSNSRANSDTETVEDVKPTLGFSLLANYGNDSEDDEDSQNENAYSPPQEVKESVSTLFPTPKVIDVKQFSQNLETKEELIETEQIDVKAFKRKRRIGVHLINHPKKEREVTFVDESEREMNEKNNKGEADDNIDNVKKKYAMNFVKGDTLKPAPSGESDASKSDSGGVDSIQQTIKEKLTFLSEGREVVSPVQVMCIQLETLYNAWKSGDLNSLYFSNWIETISNDLIKLEEDATPEGWTLEWDRQEKRYFYRNKSTNACQWEYPQKPNKESTPETPNESNPVDESKTDEEDDDAMDICNTPPPVDAENMESNIEVTKFGADQSNQTTQSKEENTWKSSTNTKGQESKDINFVLDSFYSDIAAIETATLAQTEQPNIEVIDKIIPVVVNAPNNNTALAATASIISKDCNNAIETVKKKKKVKMSHGISMKKKGVSQLVEKWKNVQRNLD